tara:strand:+ start:282 stop:587 length:306 start_codon:yes stop_codon:yes gene_type:complete
MEKILFNNTDLDITEKEILILKTNRGRKVNLFVSGWELSKEELKEHLKNLKRKFGCNGSVKMEEIEGNEKMVIHLQGDHTDKVFEYIKGIVDNSYKIIVKK